MNETKNENVTKNFNEEIQRNDTPLPEEEKTVIGVVSNCNKLNVRENAQKKVDNVLCIVEVGDELVIDKKKSTNAWYFVTTATGVSGYCMKEFVTVSE